MIDFNQWGQEPRKEIDFATIKAISLNNIESILHRWQPGGKQVRGEYLCGSIEGGKGDSCSTNISTGVGSDFASGEAWGDLIDLVSQREKVSMGEAARVLSEFLRITPDTPTPPPVQKLSEEEKRDNAARVSLALWVEGEACPATHPYLLKKMVNADPGIRFHPATGNMLIPLRDGTDLLGVQRIFPDGTKKVNQGGTMAGCYHVIPGEHDVVYICEGYATAMTVAIATGKTVVVAVSAGNLAEVGKKINKLYPSAHLVFAADNDQDKTPNPGVKAATDAVKKIGRGKVIYPPFPEDQEGDWNDYALIHGGNATRDLLLRPVKQKRLFQDLTTMQFPEPRFLIDNVLETPCTSVVFGESGGGKSFIVIDWAFHVAAGIKWLGRETVSGPVFYICGEGRHGIPRRRKAWEQHHNTNLPPNRFMMSAVTIDFTPESIDRMLEDIDSFSDHTGRPALIIIDTLARALVGNENATEDMNRFVRELDRIQTQYCCAVIVVHHPGVADQRRMRGNSALLGALDAEIFIDKHGKKIEWLKMKDSEEPAPLAFELKKVEYGDGQFDNSCAVVYSEYKREKQETAHRKAAREAMLEAVEAEGLGDRCSLDAWRELFESKTPGIKKSAIRGTLNREIERMIESGEVVKDSKYYVPILSDDQITKSIFGELI